MGRKSRRQRNVPNISITETLQPAPEGLDLDARWYLVWTTPRGEARAAEALAEAGCKVFWPNFERVIRRKNKPEIKNLISTFPRYLFASGLPSLARRLTVVGADGRSGITIDGRPIDDIRQLDGVVSVVSGPDGWQRVPTAAIRAVAEYQGVEKRPVPPAKPLPKIGAGSRVVIIDGPFCGFQATVVDSIGLAAARVLLHVFGRPTHADMALAQIEAA